MLDKWTNSVVKGDCLELLPMLPDGCVDIILADVPYGTTACKWDTIIPLEPMWKQLKRLIKPNGAIVMTASQPFTTTLIASNMKMFRYEWIWEKSRGVNYLQANKQPLKQHENILVFYKKQPIYNPIKTQNKPYTKKQVSNNHKNSTYRKDTRSKGFVTDNKGTRMPISVIKFHNPNNNNQHPTQKPVALMQYLIRTYTNEGELVLDFACGSGSTGVAAKSLNRRFIMMELEQKYVDIANKRLKQEVLGI